jgi:hypothetical protein
VEENERLSERWSVLGLEQKQMSPTSANGRNALVVEVAWVRLGRKV